MSKSMLLPQAAVSIVLTVLLAACGASDDDARTLPPPAGAAGATNAGGGGTAGGDASTDADTPPPTQDDDDGAGDDDVAAGDDQDDSDWPELRDVPDGTLTWTVVYNGTGTTRNSEAKEVAVLHRELHGTAHMRGGMGNPDEAPPSTPMDDINKAMAACGDDMACQQQAAMRAMAMARKDPAALERGMRDAMAEVQRDTTWGAMSCSAVGKADDKATWSGMTPLGFNTGVGTRAGQRAIDDCGSSEAPRLVADDNSKTYALSLPSALIRVDGRRDGRAEPVPRTVEFPQLRIEGIAYATLDRPLKGRTTLHQGRGHGIWSEGWDIALTEQVSWTFTPDTH
jgi:hypothetical protein